MSAFFTLLPPEIRNTIYEYALVRPEVYPYEYRSSRSTNRYNLRVRKFDNVRVRKYGVLDAINACSDPPSTALLRVCKQIYLEVAAMVYLRNTFVFFRLGPLKLFGYRPSQNFVNTIANVRFEHIDPTLLATEDSARIREFAQEIIETIGRMHSVKHLQVKFHAVNHTACPDRMVRRYILKYLERRGHLKRDADTDSVCEDFVNARKEFFFEYQHLQDVECDVHGSRGPKSMRNHGTVKIFINGSIVLEWEEDCTWLRNG